MESETFKMRKQFLEEFYNMDRIKFLNGCKIYVKNSWVNSLHNRVFLFDTEVVFSIGVTNRFKTFCNLLKPFVYFLYSITRYTKFLRNRLLFFHKLEIRYEKDLLGENEFGDVSGYLNISNCILEPDCENFNFLKSIKIKDFLNDSIKELKYVSLILKTKYLNVSRTQYRRLGGMEDAIIYPDIDDMIDVTEKDNEDEDREKIINPYQTFKSEECVICLTNRPNVLFCNCGHILICSKCEKLKIFNACPICKTENDNMRMLE